MAPDPLDRTPAARRRAERAVGLLARHAGRQVEDLVVIGGLNPELLAPGQTPPHQGTVDVDLVVQLDVVYDREEQDFSWLERALVSVGASPWTAATRWQWRIVVDGRPVKVEFLCDVLDNRDREIVLPGCRDVTAWNLEGPGAALRDRVVRGVRVDGEDVRLPFAGLGGYLLAKAAAVVGRTEEKDSYDFAYVVLHNEAGGPVAAARAVARALPADDSRVLGTVRAAAGRYESAASAAAQTYAAQRQLDGDSTPFAVLAEDAVGAATLFLDELNSLTEQAT